MTCQWGVKTLEVIPEGGFVIEYVGEVCSNAEIRRREEKCKNKKYGHDTTYLFDIKAGKLKQPNVIDSTYCGNSSRFISHACKSNANLQIHNVLINNSDVKTHRIALFAKKDIEQYEDLTLDYALGLSELNEDDEPLSKDKFKCFCKKTGCRRYMLQKKYIKL